MLSLRFFSPAGLCLAHVRETARYILLNYIFTYTKYTVIEELLPQPAQLTELATTEPIHYGDEQVSTKSVIQDFSNF